MTRNVSRRVRFPIFGYEVRVIFARDVMRTGRRLRVDMTGNAAACVIGEAHCWILFDTRPDADTIAHESSHAIRAMLRRAGARVDEEVFAYHLGFLVGRIHTFIERTTWATR